MPLPKSPRRWAGAFATAALLAAVAGCGPQTPGSQSGAVAGTSGGGATGATTHSSKSAPAPVVMTPSVPDGASAVTVDTLVSVRASDGSLNGVKLHYVGRDSKGVSTSGTVTGQLDKDRAGWKADERLEPSATYTLVMTGRNASDSATTTQTTKFTTQDLSLAQQTFPTLYPLKGSTVGVGMPVVLTFDTPVKDKATVQKNLHITSRPAQAGSWHWFSDTQVRYRPAKYWKPGTRVSVNADLNSVNAGGGIYGQKSVSTSFTVGRSMIIDINLKSDVGHVYRNGKQVRTLYVSAGKAGWTTRSGIKLIMAKEWNKVMTNEMIGAAESYRLTAAYALRITNSGEFLHSAPWNSAYFGRANNSHGCTGMSTANAGWLINNTLIGDPVVTTGTSRQMELDNGYGDWNISFKQYEKGSAL
jgi:lipoprotein-anchoring transpeptidase ErfK/SrfK